MVVGHLRQKNTIICLLSEEGSSHQVGPPVDFPFRGYGPYAINVQNHPMWVSHKMCVPYCRMSDIVLHRRLHQGPNPWCDNAAAATIVGFTDQALQVATAVVKRITTIVIIIIIITKPDRLPVDPALPSQPDPGI